jgi:hypothetical protein
MSGDLFQLDLVDTMDKLSFDAKGIQLSCTSKSLKEVVEFLFGFIRYIILGQEKVTSRVIRELHGFDTTDEQLACITLKFLNKIGQRD